MTIRHILTVILLINLIIMLLASQQAFPETSNVSKKQPAIKKRLTIKFKGNHELSDSFLKKAAVDDLSDFTRLGFRRADADDAAFQMETVYRNKGFAFAKVNFSLEHLDNKVTLIFNFSEGPKVSLGKISITGNATLKTKDLLSFLKDYNKTGITMTSSSVFVESEINDAVSYMNEYYHSLGYLDVRISTPVITFSKNKTRADIQITIEEGFQSILKAVSYTPAPISEVNSALSGITDTLLDKPYYPRRKLTLKNGIVEAYGNLGYTDIVVDITEIKSPDKGDIRLEAKIYPGPQVRIKEIEIRGNIKTKKSFILNRIGFKSGDIYRLDGKRESFRRLYRTGLFSKIDIHLLETETPDQRILVIQLEEAPAREYFFETGWGSYELLRGKAGFRDRNVMGTGRIVSAETGMSFKSESFTLSLNDPWFMNMNMSADAPFRFYRREEPSFTREETGLSLIFSKPVAEHIMLVFGYVFKINRLSDVNIYETVEDLENDYNIASLKFQASYDTRNDIFFPTSGIKNFVSFDMAERILGGNTSFYRMTGGSRFFYPLTESTTLALRYETGLVLPGRKESSVPLGEVFFNGGENTVRSFGEYRLGPKDSNNDPTGGFAFNVANLELRHMFLGNLAGTFFIDFGNISPGSYLSDQGQQVFDTRSKLISATFREYLNDVRTGIGVGIQYLLPIGPIRLDAAINPSPRKEKNEDRFMVHFSVGMAF